MPQETTTAQALVQLDGVSKVFGAGTQRVTAIADLNLSLQAGESLSVVGPSCCCKTTLLLLLAGLEKPSTGSLVFQGNPLAGTRTEIALVLQHYGLFPWKTVRRNIELGFTIRREQHYQQRVSAMLEHLGIADKSRAYPAQLSGGQQQRVALARMLEPELALGPVPPCHLARMLAVGLHWPQGGHGDNRRGAVFPRNDCNLQRSGLLHLRCLESR